MSGISGLFSSGSAYSNAESVSPSAPKPPAREEQLSAQIDSRLRGEVQKIRSTMAYAAPQRRVANPPGTGTLLDIEA